MSKQITQLPNVVNTDTGALVLAPENMSNIIQFAEFMATAGPMLPTHLHNKPADCMAIVLQSMQWGMSPFAVAQKTHLVNGALGYESQLVNAVVSSSRAIEGRFHYRYEGDWENGGADRRVIVGAILRGESDIQWGEPLYPAKVTTKNSPLWKTAEKQQASYLALKYWARLYCPAVMLGVYTPEELQDIEPRDVTPTAKTIDLKALQGGKSESGEDDAIDGELQDVLDAFADAKTKDELADAAEKAKLLSEESQLKARPAYQKRLAELKKSAKPAPETIDQEPETERSEAFLAIEKLTSMANTTKDLQAIDNMPHWKDLNQGEAPILRKLIDLAEKELVDNSADGAFTQ